MSSLEENWDLIADYIEEDPMRPYRYGKALRYINKLDKNIKILEVGCGEGTGLSFFSDYEYKELYGIEISEERIKRAEDKNKIKMLNCLILNLMKNCRLKIIILML